MRACEYKTLISTNYPNPMPITLIRAMILFKCASLGQSEKRPNNDLNYSTHFYYFNLSCLHCFLLIFKRTLFASATSLKLKDPVSSNLGEQFQTRIQLPANLLSHGDLWYSALVTTFR
jgi:hypothetical protein